MGEERIYKAAVYARISVEDGRDGSIESQAAMGRAYVASRRDMRLQGIYRDAGRTGTNFRRPAFEAMLQAAGKGLVDCVVVKDFSRLGRNYLETGRYMERVFPALGIRLVSVTDGYDSLEEAGSGEMLAAGLKNLVNELYARDTGRRVRLAKKIQREAGSYAGGSPPYGFRLVRQEEKRLLAPALDTAGYVRWMFDMAVSGWTPAGIGRGLDRQGVLAPRAARGAGGPRAEGFAEGSRWRPETVRAILKNPLYAGLGPGVLEPVVCREVWEQVQERRRKRAGGGKRPGKREGRAGGPDGEGAEETELSGLWEVVKELQGILYQGCGWNPLGEGGRGRGAEEKRRRLAGRAAALYAMGREETLDQVRQCLGDWGPKAGEGYMRTGPGQRVRVVLLGAAWGGRERKGGKAAGCLPACLKGPGMERVVGDGKRRRAR